MDDISDRLKRLIETSGPISIAQFMAEANGHYYATRDPLGAKGDFITAPEISQMFGELVGLWLADLWMRAGKPIVRFVELGPGRGTLAQDALRAMRAVGLTPAPHFVEASPILRAKQAERVPHAIWHDDVSTLPSDAPLLIVANEFFDALPVRQLVRTIAGWRERMVGYGPEGFVPVPGQTSFDRHVPDRLRGADPGGILETSPASVTIMQALSERIANQGGAALVIDYGYVEHAHGDTLQAVHAHAYADPFARPGASDLTAHVDFGVMEHAIRAGGAVPFGPAPQGAWLETLGIRERAANLAAASPARAEEIQTARGRLTHPDEMGELFKVLAAVSSEWPEPEGFGAA